MKEKQEVNIFWFRRDLRLHDNHGLFESLQSDAPVLPLFIFDADILDSLPCDDHRVTFIYETLHKINDELEQHGSSLLVRIGKPAEIFNELAVEYNIISINSNRDYEPYGIERDRSIADFCSNEGIAWNQYQDHVIFEPGDILKPDGTPYQVYTAYKNKWLLEFSHKKFEQFNSENFLDKMIQKKFLFPSLESIGFAVSDKKARPAQVSQEIADSYGYIRDFPEKGSQTTQLGPHLRFGTESVRSAVKTIEKSEDPTLLSEIIWREFFMQIFYYRPDTLDHAYHAKYDSIQWRNNEQEFQAWKEGMTGYPMVDAGMRELKETGYMHNRVRMVVASFLTKHLLIDWRCGERYFAEQLFDYEMSSNVGNWQWVAGTGVDAAPYFRIFNPEAQAKKFDPQGIYIRRWVPEVGTPDYPDPIVVHEEARKRCLVVYAKLS
jgi:deoxyribodipyrimidine photo-lyase